MPDAAACRRIASVAARTLRVSDADTGEYIGSFEWPGLAVHACSFSPDGARVVSGSSDGTLKLWDSESRVAAGDVRGVLYRLRLEGFDVGPPILTGVRLWLFDHHDWDDRLTAMCPLHGGRFEVTEMMLGEEVLCPECGETLELNPFVCDNANHS